MNTDWVTLSCTDIPFSEGHLPHRSPVEQKVDVWRPAGTFPLPWENPCLIELALLATRLLWTLSSFLKLLSACTAHTREHMISSTTATLGLTWADQLLNVRKTLTELRKEHRANCATKGCLSYLMSKCNLFPLAREQTKGKARRMKLLNLSAPTFRTLGLLFRRQIHCLAFHLKSHEPTFLWDSFKAPKWQTALNFLWPSLISPSPWQSGPEQSKRQ